MKYELSLAKEAQHTIEEQLEWYEADEQRGGKELADRWLALLELALNKLTSQPQRHGLAPENGRWRPELKIRQLQFRPWKSGVGWRVLFVVDERNKMVTILQVRHERRRWFFEGDDEAN